MRDRFVEERLPAPAALPEFCLLDYPDRLNAAAELLKGGASDALAVVNDHGRWTYADLDDYSGRIARLLVDEHGLVPGNRVLLRGPNGYTMFAAWLAILAEGGAGPEHLVRMTCYVTSIEAYSASLAEIGAAWKAIVGRHYPAMALVEVVRLVEPEAKIEIEATAVIPE